MSLSISKYRSEGQVRVYQRESCVVFRKTDAPFGGLSNMAAGYPLNVQGTPILTSEALYQACRFPHMPEVQRLIIQQTSPMTAKMKSKPYRSKSRSDWNRVRVNVMRWCLRVKLAQNWNKFSDLLLRTYDSPIVEESRRDDFWGAKSIDQQTLVGMNVLGRLLMELRGALTSEQHLLLRVDPPDISEFMLLGRPILSIYGSVDSPTESTVIKFVQGTPVRTNPEQPSLLYASVSPDAPPPICTTSNIGDFSNLIPYQVTKDSIVPWLEHVPEHWKLERAKWLFKKANRPVRDTDEVVTCFRDGAVTLRKNRRVRGFTESLKEIGYQGIRRGDLVIHAMDAFAGSIGVADSDGKGSPVYSVCEPGAEANSYYYAFVLREMARTQWIQALARGIRERSTDFRFDDFSCQVLPVPPIHEQEAIVRFLNYVDLRIRKYIRAKQRLIRLLEEQKKVIIHRAVTHGLDPNIRLKPSGVKWLGAVPQHWKITRLKSLVLRVTSGSRAWSNFAADTGSLFIRIGNLTRSSIDLDLRKVVRLQLPRHVFGEATRTRVQPGDILLSITAFIGSVAVVPGDIEEAYVSQHISCCRPKPGACNPRWVSYVLLSPIGQTHGQISMYGGTKQGLSLDDVKNYVVVLPPLAEQDQLVAWIERSTSQIDIGIRTAKSEICLMEEYRARLIADVVTGKVDVRDAAAHLSEDEKQPTLFDDINSDTHTDEEFEDLDLAAEGVEV